MGKGKQKGGLYLKAPEGVKVKRHQVGERTYFTIDGDNANFRPLVAVAVGNDFSWIRSDFSA